MAVSTVKLNGTTLMTVNDTTATQADVNSTKYFYGADGVKRQGSATPSTPTLITKSITANGTYNASSDSADGYSSVTVSVSGGASNFVTGTFTGTTTGAAMDVTIPYTGTGYPIVVMVYPSGGTNKTGSPFYDLIQQYATEYFLAIKNDISAVPVFDASGTNGMCSMINRYKSSASNATSRSQSASESILVMRDQSAQGGNQTLCKITSSTVMSVYIASTSYGFAANIEYTYVVQYSS